MKVNEKKLQDLNKQEFYEALTICNEKQIKTGKKAATDAEVIRFALMTNSISKDKVNEFLKGN